MTLVPNRGVFFAIATALLMHLALFVAVAPSGGRAMDAVQAPPSTRYADQAAETETAGPTVRIVRSPVIFSLPSQMGFSRALREHDVQTRKAFMQQPTQSESFLEVASYTKNVAGRIQPEKLMISALPHNPALPKASDATAREFPQARRVTMSPRLRSRLVGGIVLSPELNKAVEKPWKVLASVNVSEQGAVEHVLLDHPLESSLLNDEIIRMLYGLRFKAGNAEDGTVEIYSSEGSVGPGEVK